MNRHNIETSELGHLCGRGHFCWGADDDYNGECGSKTVGRVVFIPDTDLTDEDRQYVENALADAEFHLAEQIEAWRAAE